MRAYPIRVPFKSYRGANPKIRNVRLEEARIAAKIEKYINDDLKDKPDDTIHSYMSYVIAAEISEDTEVVRRLIMGVDGGSHGMTIFKGDYEKAMENLA